MMTVAEPAIASPRRAFPGVRWAIAGPALALLLASTFCYLHFYDQQHTLIHNDLIGRQFATRAALHGVSPYSRPMTQQIQAVAGHDPGQGFDYPILLAVLLAPVAAVPWETLRLGFLLIMIPALFASFLACLRLVHVRLAPSQAIALALLCLLSWPVVFGLRMQQPTLLAAVLILSACYLLSRNYRLSAGVLLALSTFKPQLVLPLVLWLLLWSASRRRWTFPLAFAVTETLLLVSGERLVPGWLPQWLATLPHYRSLGNIPPLELYAGHWVGACLTAALLLGSLWQLWQLRRCTPESRDFGYAIALALATSLCLTPVIWGMIYNQVLLIPAALLLLRAVPPPHGRITALVWRLTQALLAWTFVSVPLAALGEALVPSGLFLSLPFLGHLLAPLLTLTLLTASVPAQPA